MSEPGQIELVEDETLNGLGRHSGQERGISYAGADFLVDGEGQRVHERGLADEDQIVSAGEVLEEEAQFAEAVGLEKTGDRRILRQVGRIGG